MFGEESVPKIFRGEKLFVAVDGKKANINLTNLVCFFKCYLELILLKMCIFLGSNMRRRGFATNGTSCCI